MNHPKLTWIRSAAKKLVMLVVIAGLAIASYATLGDVNRKSNAAKGSLLSSKKMGNGTFSLKSGYTYRGNQLFNQNTSSRYITLNTTVTYQRGNTTFTIPLKKKVFLSNVKIDIGNRQFQRN